MTPLTTLTALVPLTTLSALSPLPPAPPHTLALPGPAAQLPSQAALQPAYLLLIAGPRDTRQSLSLRYNAPPEAVWLDGELTQPALNAPLTGRTVRIALPLTPSAGRLAPGIRRVTVRPGDTLSRLEARYNLSERELISANLELASLDTLNVGSTLNIPTSTRGLLLTIKAGQDAASLIQGYHADPLWTAKVNHFTLPTELHPGDQLLLPGIFARGLHEELLLRRKRAQVQAQQEKILARYNAFLAWKAQRQHAREVQYQRYQAWLQSPQRLAAVAKYQRQAAYEVWQAHEARAQLQLQAQQEALEAAQEAQAQQELRTQMAQLTAQDPRPQMQAAAQAEAAAPALNLSWPLDHPRLTSRFGEEDIAFHQEVFHGGQDMAAPEGTPIYAAAGGTVTRSGEGAYGINVYVEQGDNTYIYGHMSQTGVEVGQTVKQGDFLGYVGCTGMCTGPHLHFEVRLGGVAVDPMAFLPQDHTAKINVPAPPLQLANLQAAHAKAAAHSSNLALARTGTPALKGTLPKAPTNTTSTAAPASATAPVNVATPVASSSAPNPNVIFTPAPSATAGADAPAGSQ